MLTARLREEAKRALGSTQQTITVGHVEWMPNESVDALEARAEAALASPGRRDWAERASVVRSRAADAALGELQAEPTEALRRDVLDALAHEILEGRRFGRSLAVVVLDVDGLDEPPEGLDREVLDAVLGRVARRLSDSVGSGSVHRLGAARFALVLSGGSANDAEALLETLHSTVDDDGETGDVSFSAGVTELIERDGAETALGRAEHALWQATQAGRGTIVVAVPGRRSPRIPVGVARASSSSLRSTVRGGTSFEVASPVCVSTRRSSPDEAA